MAVLDQQFPADLAPTLHKAEQNAYRSYAYGRYKVYIANAMDTEALDVYLNTKPITLYGLLGSQVWGRGHLVYWVKQQRQTNPRTFLMHYK